MRAKSTEISVSSINKEGHMEWEILQYSLKPLKWGWNLQSKKIQG